MTDREGVLMGETVDSSGNGPFGARGRKSDRVSSWKRFHNSELQILSDPKIITDIAKNGVDIAPHLPDHRLQSGSPRGPPAYEWMTAHSLLKFPLQIPGWLF